VSTVEEKERLITSLKEAGGQLRVRSALNPILWLCGIVIVPSISAIIWMPNPPAVITNLLYTVVFTAVGGFIYLMIFDRDRLQSEEFLLKSRTLDLIEEKGSRKAIDAATVKVISQTEFLALDSPEGES
jgi:uncharacterized membrane protein